MFCYPTFVKFKKKFFLGITPSTAVSFHVTIEKSTVFEVGSFQEAVAYWFCSYFVLNLQFPKPARLTMEFIQRY